MQSLLRACKKFLGHHFDSHGRASRSNDNSSIYIYIYTMNGAVARSSSRSKGLVFECGCSWRFVKLAGLSGFALTIMTRIILEHAQSNPGYEKHIEA